MCENFTRTSRDNRPRRRRKNAYKGLSGRQRLTFERLVRTKFIFQYLFIITTPNYAQKMSEKFSRPSRDNRPRRRPTNAYRDGRA